MAVQAMMTKKAIFMITPEEHAWLVEESARRKVSMASLVRDWIDQARACTAPSPADRSQKNGEAAGA